MTAFGILRWGDYLGIIGAKCNHKDLIRREAEGDGQWNQRVKWYPCWKGPQAKECGRLLEAEKGKETDSLLRAFRRNQLCPHFDFSPRGLISNI